MVKHRFLHFAPLESGRSAGLCDSWLLDSDPLEPQTSNSGPIFLPSYPLLPKAERELVPLSKRLSLQLKFIFVWSPFTSCDPVLSTHPEVSR